jgi:hypothetical protein
MNKDIGERNELFVCGKEKNFRVTEVWNTQESARTFDYEGAWKRTVPSHIQSFLHLFSPI